MSMSRSAECFLDRDHSARRLEETPRRNKAPQGGLRERKNDRSGQMHAQCLGATLGSSPTDGKNLVAKEVNFTFMHGC